MRKRDEEKRGIINSGQTFTDIIPAYFPQIKNRRWKYLKGLRKATVSYSLYI